MGQNRQSTVIGLGELLWDIFPDARRPGGAPANVAFQACQLGCRGVVCSRVGDDELGREIRDFLRGQGLETSSIQIDRDHPTGTVTVDTSVADHPEYVIHEDVAWDHLAWDGPTRELMEQADAVCFGTLAQRSPVSRETILRCLLATSETCRIVYDVNLRQTWYDRIAIERSLQSADVVKLNHHETDVLAKLLDIGPTDPRRFANALQTRFEVPLTCITRGENGCLLIRNDEVVDIPGVRIDVSDAVGAGDAFTAALIFALLQDWPLPVTGAFANRVGALVASRPGAMPPLSVEFRELVTEFAA